MKLLIQMLSQISSIIIVLYLILALVLIYIVYKLLVELKQLSKSADDLNNKLIDSKARYENLLAILPEKLIQEDSPNQVLSTLMSTSFWVMAAKSVYDNRKRVKKIVNWFIKSKNK